VSQKAPLIICAYVKVRLIEMQYIIIKLLLLLLLLLFIPFILNTQLPGWSALTGDFSVSSASRGFDDLLPPGGDW
jgi:predicted CDP-diglyceride synthetase/phosphatidate cytidylyltransferase